MNTTYIIYYQNDTQSESATITPQDYNELFRIFQSLFQLVPGISRIYFETNSMTGTVYHEN